MGASEQTILATMENDMKKIESDCGSLGNSSDKEEFDGHISVDDNESSPETAKPQLSYIALITKAIKSKPSHMATLGEICKYISDNYNYYKVRFPKWQNSIRHNLSLNDCFVKVARGASNPGKGNYWKMDPMSANMFENGSMLRRRKRFKRQDTDYYTLFHSHYYNNIPLPHPMAYSYQVSPPYLPRHNAHHYHPYQNHRMGPVTVPTYATSHSVPGFQPLSPVALAAAEFEMRQRLLCSEAATGHLNFNTAYHSGLAYNSQEPDCRRSPSPPATNEASLSDEPRSPSPRLSSKKHRSSPSPFKCYKKKKHSSKMSKPSTSSDPDNSSAPSTRHTSFTIESILQRPTNCPRPPSPTDGGSPPSSPPPPVLESPPKLFSSFYPHQFPPNSLVGVQSYPGLVG